MADDGRVVFSITGDNRPLRQTLNETTDAIQRESRNWDRAADESSANMSRAFGQAFNVERVKNFAIAAGKALLQLGKEAISAASDLQEVQNVVEATFGGDSGKIDEWARKAGEQFGLTETQAKRFTSTIGAMAKSAGMAGPEIVQMSTDLAGLAADMASFYNLDFDEAFQKIRSGISGQTEPLKQLGINMNEATLNAFALQQGLTKTFSQMSQGEQIMLRYQYMMQATADAQGDFARTSDGYANSMRMLETNIDTLKTALGEALIPTLTDVITNINNVVGALTQKHDRTILDEFADIQLDTQTKLTEIDTTTTKAQALVEILDKLNAFTLTDEGEATYLGDLAGSVNTLQNSKPRLWKGLIDALDDATFSDELNATTAQNVEDVANGANALDITAYSKWDKLKASLKDFTVSDDLKGTNSLGTIAADANSLDSATSGRWDKLMTALGNTGALSGLADAGANISALSAAINSDGASTDKAAAWQTLLGALAENADALTSLTGESAEGTKAWLETLAAGANTLDPNSAEGWDKLKETFTQGFTGGESGEVFGDFFTKTGEYAEYLSALGIETDGVADAQALWLQVCRELITYIPGLSSIINAETGEVEGGTKALKDYILAWNTAEKLPVLQAANDRYLQALENSFSDLPDLFINTITTEQRVKRAREALAASGQQVGDEEAIWAAMEERGRWSYNKTTDEAKLAVIELGEALLGANEAARKYDSRLKEQGEAYEMYEERVAAVAEVYGEEATAASDAAESTYLTGDAATAATNAMTGLGEALQAVNDYYDNTRQSTETMVRSVVQGFGQIESPAERARAEFRNLNKELANLSDAEIDIKLAGDGSVPTAANMLKGLEDQIAYMDEYHRRLVAARKMGFSDELLASLSDGSLESYDYLGALTDATATQVEQINAKYAEAEAGKEQFTDNLTATKLRADEVFQALVDDANAMVTELDLADGAQNAMESTLSGLVNGIAAKLPDLTTEVDLVLEQLARLDAAYGFSFNKGHIITGFMPGTGILSSGGNVTLASNAKGLDYVPFDGYLSVLHEGESILTDAEARVWRNFKYGGASGANSIDYDALGGVMRDNVSAGGNVYLDGRTVGRVISASQANSFRNLERSGWQG